MRRPLLDWLPLRRFVVRETSMQPALRPGDRLLVASWLRPRTGDLVVVRDPEQRTVFLVKRVANLEPNGDLVLHADNPNVGRDSLHFGPVPRRLLVGRVVFRYLPSERRGWLASRQ
jgi:nickel-type superoxide dismutase maturation protease